MEAKDLLESFIAENTQEVDGICMYLESLIGLNDISLAEDFLNSLSNEVVKTEKIKKIKDRVLLIKNTDKGPSLEKLKQDLESAPNNLDIVFKITDTHFANNNFDSCFDVLLNYYKGMNSLTNLKHTYKGNKPEVKADPMNQPKLLEKQVLPYSTANIPEHHNKASIKAAKYSIF